MYYLIVCVSTSGVLLESAASDEELSTHLACSNHGQGRLVSLSGNSHHLDHATVTR